MYKEGCLNAEARNVAVGGVYNVGQPTTRHHQKAFRSDSGKIPKSSYLEIDICVVKNGKYHDI